MKDRKQLACPVGAAGHGRRTGRDQYVSGTVQVARLARLRDQAKNGCPGHPLDPTARPLEGCAAFCVDMSSRDAGGESMDGAYRHTVCIRAAASACARPRGQDGAVRESSGAVMGVGGSRELVLRGIR